FLQYAVRATVVALLEHDPTERVSKMWLVRRRFVCFLRQIEGLVELSEVVGIDNRKVVERYGGVWRDREQVVISIACCRKVLHALVNRREQQEGRRALIFLNRNIKLVYRLILSVRGDVKLCQ